MLNTEFNEFCETDEQRALNLYPEARRAAIDAINVEVYPNLNNGASACVSRSGRARERLVLQQMFLCKWVRLFSGWCGCLQKFV